MDDEIENLPEQVMDEDHTPTHHEIVEYILWARQYGVEKYYGRSAADWLSDVQDLVEAMDH